MNTFLKGTVLSRLPTIAVSAIYAVSPFGSAIYYASLGREGVYRLQQVLKRAPGGAMLGRILQGKRPGALLAKTPVLS